MKRPLPQSLLFCLTALLLGACSGGQLNKNVSFDHTAENSLVVVGITTTADPWRTAPQLVWTSYDSSTRILGPEFKRVRHRSDEDFIDFLNAANLFLSDSGGHNYLVFSIPPGTWVLEQVYAWRRHQTGYSFVSAVYAPTYDDTLIQSILRTNAYAFTVKAGEAIYIGEFVVTEYGNLAVNLGDEDIDRARDRMTEYPGVTSTLVYRPLEKASFTCVANARFGAVPYCGPKADSPLP